jgi:ribosomal-protein-alanine N-acetyltransferase
MNILQLETDRLFLKGFSPEDMNFIFTQLSKNEIKELLGHKSEDDYLKELEKQKNGYASYNRSFILFLLIDKKTNKVIGRCGIHNWNKEHERAEIGYIITDEDFKNKGLMSEAVKTIIHFSFHTLQLHRLEAMASSENTFSVNILKKNNFTREGLLRKHYKIEDRFEDSILFSLLREEFLLIA